jgi:hypothetical protein
MVLAGQSANRVRPAPSVEMAHVPPAHLGRLPTLKLNLKRSAPVHQVGHFSTHAAYYL